MLARHFRAYIIKSVTVIRNSLTPAWILTPTDWEKLLYLPFLSTQRISNGILFLSPTCSDWSDIIYKAFTLRFGPVVGGSGRCVTGFARNIVSILMSFSPGRQSNARLQEAPVRHTSQKTFVFFFSELGREIQRARSRRGHDFGYVRILPAKVFSL